MRVISTDTLQYQGIGVDRAALIRLSSACTVHGRAPAALGAESLVILDGGNSADATHDPAMTRP